MTERNSKMENETIVTINDFLFTKREPKKNQSERGDLLDLFLKKVNKEREGTKFKPLTMKALAVKLSHLKTEDLYFLKSICVDYERRKGSFSKCLFGSIKVGIK